MYSAFALQFSNPFWWGRESSPRNCRKTLAKLMEALSSLRECSDAEQSASLECTLCQAHQMSDCRFEPLRVLAVAVFKPLQFQSLNFLCWVLVHNVHVHCKLDEFLV